MSTDQKEKRTARVLIAEDNKDMRDKVVQLLEDEFEVVGVVADGRALVAAVDRLSPDAGVINISMPLMNGIEAAIEIKKRDPDMKIIFLTINEDADFVKAAFDAGAAGYVIKRQMAPDLPLAINEALAGRSFLSSGCEMDPDLLGLRSHAPASQ